MESKFSECWVGDGLTDRGTDGGGVDGLVDGWKNGIYA